MEGWKFWWGIAAFFLGGLSTQMNGWLTYRRQRADKAEEAKDALRQRREEFELQHLVELNQLVRVAIDQLFAYSTAEHWSRAARQTDSLDVERRQQSEETGATFMVTLADLTSQVPFILADDVRQAAGDLIGYMAEASALLIGGVPLNGVALSAVADRLYKPLGERVRAIYAGQAAA
ncbi:hypothetical protein [Streptomyces turgidiscabies]|uniref:hypothetical protein n=1 Tax=Streptomyces turgidiscabies TaxID=85558 RepID=UPI0038F7F9D8